jgi:hypothetical protein
MDELRTFGKEAMDGLETFIALAYHDIQRAQVMVDQSPSRGLAEPTD